MSQEGGAKTLAEKEEQPRSIRFPPKVWAALDEDAARCRRSPVRQLESILLSLYEIEDVELDRNGLERARERVTRVPVQKANQNEQKSSHRQKRRA